MDLHLVYIYMRMCPSEFAEGTKRLQVYNFLNLFQAIYNSYASILCIISQDF